MAAIKDEIVVALAKTVEELNAIDLRFALVGGLAVGARGEPRVTRDIDFVVPSEDDAAAEQIIFAVQRRGFTVRAVFEREGNRISTVRFTHPIAPDVFIDFLMSNSRVEAEITQAASMETVAGGVMCLVAQSAHLLAMKVLANRKKDQPDLQQLVEAATAKDLAASQKTLQLMQQRGVAPERNLRRELRMLVKQVRGELKFERPASRSRLERIVRHNPVT